MRWNVILTLVSRLHVQVRPRAFGAFGLWALVGSSVCLAGCQTVRAYQSDVCTLDCSTKASTECVCATPDRATGLSDRPPGAKPDEVWCKVLIPAVYETITEDIETVCPSVQRSWVPPVMETRVIPVIIEPACTQVIRTPGATRVDAICTEVCPARTETRVVVHRDACGCGVKSCETVHVPAVMGTRPREVCVQAPATEIVHTPAVLSANVCQVEVRPGYWEETRMPGIRERRSRIVCTSPERWEWQRDPACGVPAPPPPPCLPTTRPAPLR